MYRLLRTIPAIISLTLSFTPAVAGPPITMLFVGPSAPRPSLTGFEAGFDATYGKELRRQGIESTSIPGTDVTLDQLKRFHVVVVVGNPPAAQEDGRKVVPPQFTRFCQTLHDYQRLGGGVFFMPHGSEYMPESRDLTANAMLAPFGAGIVHEALIDPNHAYRAERFQPLVWDYFWTTAIQTGPVTAGVSTLFLPVTGSHYSAATLALKVDTNWTVVAKGMETCRSASVDVHAMEKNKSDDMAYLFDQNGSVSSAPALMAIREGADGAGRAALLAVSPAFTISNWRSVVLGDVAMERGVVVRRSDLAVLLVNTYRWLADPALRVASLGGFRYEPPRTDLSPVNWDRMPVPAKRPVLRGLIGAHSDLSDGRSSVAAYMAAAATSCLAFVVFTEPVKATNAEKYARLVDQCKAASTPTCLALPGLEYEDSSGFHWVDFVTWHFPDQAIIATDGRLTSPLAFETKDWHAHCLAQSGKEMEHPWFQHHFTGIVPLSWKADRLVDNSMPQYLSLEANNHNLIPIAHTRVLSVGEMAQALAAAHLTCFWGNSSAEFRDLYQAECMQEQWPQRTFLSNGPMIERWEISNCGGFPWRPLANRLRLYLTVSSPVGLSEVRIHDAATGKLYRRFDAKGQNEFDVVIDEAHAKQHYWVAEIVDCKGRSAVSPGLRTYQEGNRAWIMSDRFMAMNHPHDWSDDRTFILTYTGADPGYVKSTPLAGMNPPNSFADSLNLVGIDGGTKCPAVAEVWPLIHSTRGDEPLAPAFRHDLKLASFDLHVIDYLGQTKCPDTLQPWYTPYGDPVRRQVPNELADVSVRYFVYRPRFHQDAYCQLAEVAAVIKKDIILAGPTPIRLLQMRKNQLGVPGEFDHVTLRDTSGRVLTWNLDYGQPLSHEGTLVAGDYISLHNFSGGAPLFVALSPDIHYRLFGTGGGMAADISLGQPGQALKKGNRLSARFLLLTLPKQIQTSNLWIETFRKDFGLGGAKPSYAFAVSRGKIASAQYELVVKGDHGGAELSIGRHPLAQNLPIVVHGMAENLPAGIYDQDSKSLRELPVYCGSVYTTVDTRDTAHRVFIGNLLKCSRADLIVSMVPTASGWLIEAHNPTEKAIATTLTGDPGFTPLAGWSKAIAVPPGASVKLSK